MRTFAISTSCRSASDSEPDDPLGTDARHPDAPERLDRGLIHGVLVDDDAAHRLGAEREVVRDRQVREQAQLLVDDADAELVRMRGARDLDRLAAELDAPGRRRMVAREDLQQGRLAGTVLAEEAVDRACLDVEVDVIEGQRAREALRDAPHAEQRRPLGVDRARGVGPRLLLVGRHALTRPTTSPPSTASDAPFT